MLQQTQAHRVIPKYKEFISLFPSFTRLAQAPLSDVLRTWKGLGYSRRALYLKKIAESITAHHNKTLPRTRETLESLPGIGPYTAGALLAFAYNLPAVCIETNIRTVFIHFFFADKTTKVHDRDLLPLIEQTIDKDSPREWYYALMDYGALLKSKKTVPNTRSIHYKKQSTFKGSNRELRSTLLSHILETPGIALSTLGKETEKPVDHITKNLSAMEQEGLIKQKNKRYYIT